MFENIILKKKICFIQRWTCIIPILVNFLEVFYVLLWWFSHGSVNLSITICQPLLTLWRLPVRLRVENIINKLFRDVLVIWLSPVLTIIQSKRILQFYTSFEWRPSNYYYLVKKSSIRLGINYNIIYNTFLYTSCLELQFFPIPCHIKLR